MTYTPEEEIKWRIRIHDKYDRFKRKLIEVFSKNITVKGGARILMQRGQDVKLHHSF